MVFRYAIPEWYTTERPGEYREDEAIQSESVNADAEVHDNITLENITESMEKLLSDYNSKEQKTMDDLIEFHYMLERIHPFYRGNGQISRMLLFRECLHNKIIPILLTEDLVNAYQKGMENWDGSKGMITYTCLAAQDKVTGWMEEFEIQI